MKSKITKIDPTGVTIESKDFYIPFIGKTKKVTPKLTSEFSPDNIKYEPMCQNRFLLEIGDYKYWMRIDGEIIDKF
jgi:hypothetical protein